MFVVLFNHQGERVSFVIAWTAVAIRFVTSSRGPWRLALVLLSLTGINALGHLPVRLTMQLELLGGEATWEEVRAMPNRHPPPRHREH